jgi:hypothetical protein
MVDSNPLLTDIDLAGLQIVNHWLILRNNGRLGQLAFENLLYSQNITIQQNAALQQVYLPRLKYDPRI